MNNQTAVEWLVEQLEQHHTKIDIKNTVVFQQAKEIEKQQIIDAYLDGGEKGFNNFGENAEQYYNETYGN